MHYSLCDSILDLFQNAVEADSTHIEMDFLEEGSKLSINIRDNGKGMDENTLSRVQDPFFTDGEKHRERKVGLGIPFLIQTTEQTDGYFHIKSVLDMGTELNICFNLDHWDTPPTGNVVDMLVSAMTFDGGYEFIFKRESNNTEQNYTLKRHELVEVLGDLTHVTNMILLKEFIESQELDN